MLFRSAMINKRRENGKLHDIILVAEGVGSATDIAKELEGKVKVYEIKI